jgi:REP element-mobilizing transposase RayT
MARKPRIHIPGGFYHVMLRGNGGADIFFTEADRYRFYLLMQEGVERYGHRIHAFCLMSNHVHLVIQVGDVSLSRIMQNLSFRYTRWINGQRKRTGHLFQGRFKAILVDEDDYLLTLVRYTHMNPVRAGIVKEIGDYPWSSHAAYLGLEIIPWLETETVLSRFSDRLATARQCYAEFIFDGMAEGHRGEFHSGPVDVRVLGNDGFTERALAGSEKLVPKCTFEDCVSVVCQHYRMRPEDLSGVGRRRRPSEARAVVAWLIRRHGDMTLAEVAKRFGRDAATISTSVRRLEEKILELNDLCALVDAIEKDVSNGVLMVHHE